MFPLDYTTGSYDVRYPFAVGMPHTGQKWVVHVVSLHYTQSLQVYGDDILSLCLCLCLVYVCFYHISPYASVVQVSGLFAPRTYRPMDTSPDGRTFRPIGISTHGRFNLWTSRPTYDSPQRRFFSGLNCFNSALTLLAGQQKGHLACTKLGVALLVVTL